MEPAESFPETHPEAAQPAGHGDAEKAPIAPIVALPDFSSSASQAPAYQPYDFRKPSFLSPAQLRKLRLRQEGFLRSLASRLSVYLRLEVSLQMSALKTLTYQELLKDWPSPTCLTLFKTEPLRGIGLLNIPTRLGLTLVDRLLGGPAQSVNLQRDLSEIESALFDQAVQVLLGEWCGQWKFSEELRPVILGRETDGRFLQTSERDAVMLVLAAEMRLGDCVEQIQIAFPAYTIEPLVDRLDSPIKSGDSPAPAVSQNLRWNPNLDEVPLPMTAEWNGIEITVREAAQLKAGDLLELSPDSVNQVQLRLSGAAKFLGRLGTRDNHWGVEITQIVKSEKPAA